MLQITRYGLWNTKIPFGIAVFLCFTDQIRLDWSGQSRLDFDVMWLYESTEVGEMES